MKERPSLSLGSLSDGIDHAFSDVNSSLSYCVADLRAKGTALGRHRIAEIRMSRTSRTMKYGNG